jgi:hypothetical protein
MFDTWTIAAVAAYQIEYYKRQRPVDPPMLPYNQPTIAPPVAGKCPCCGSRQFVTHHDRRICSYCRSEQ